MTESRASIFRMAPDVRAHFEADLAAGWRKLEHAEREFARRKCEVEATVHRLNALEVALKSKEERLEARIREWEDQLAEQRKKNNGIKLGYKAACDYADLHRSKPPFSWGDAFLLGLSIFFFAVTAWNLYVAFGGGK